MKARRVPMRHGGNFEGFDISWSVQALSNRAVDGEAGTPKCLSTCPSDQAVSHEGKNLKLFAHLTTETVLDCIFGPFKQLGIPSGAVIQGDRRDSSEGRCWGGDHQPNPPTGLAVEDCCTLLTPRHSWR